MPNASEHIEVSPDAIASFDSKAPLSTSVEMSPSSGSIKNAITSDGNERVLLGVSTKEGSALDDSLAFKALSFAEEENGQASAKGYAQSHDDTWVLLRPEGIIRPLAKKKQNRTDERIIQTRFHTVVKIRTYVKDSAPNLQSENSADWSPSLTASVLATKSGPMPLASDLQDEPSAYSKVQKNFIECEELLEILERSLPAETNDPNSVVFTKLAIDITRAAVKDVHRAGYKDQQKVEYALGSMDHAICFHEETLRRVNRAAGPSDFESFEREAISVEEAIDKRRLAGGGC